MVRESDVGGCETTIRATDLFITLVSSIDYHPSHDILPALFVHHSRRTNASVDNLSLAWRSSSIKLLQSLIFGGEILLVHIRWIAKGLSGSVNPPSVPLLTSDILSPILQCATTQFSDDSLLSLPGHLFKSINTHHKRSSSSSHAPQVFEISYHLT